MRLDKRKMFLRASIESQFSYCPLIWMFHSRTLNNKINRLHEKALRIAYGDYKSKFDELLEKDIDLTDLFLECENDNISSYADDTTPYSCAQDISSVISELQRITKNFFDWCRNNHVKANPEKCHIILSSYTQREIRFANTSITSSPSEKLLGIALDSELKFEEHVNKI